MHFLLGVRTSRSSGYSWATQNVANISRSPMNFWHKSCAMVDFPWFPLKSNQFSKEHFGYDLNPVSSNSTVFAKEICLGCWHEVRLCHWWETAWSGEGSGSHYGRVHRSTLTSEEPFRSGEGKCFVQHFRNLCRVNPVVHTHRALWLRNNEQLFWGVGQEIWRTDWIEKVPCHGFGVNVMSDIHIGFCACCVRWSLPTSLFGPLALALPQRRNKHKKLMRPFASGLPRTWARQPPSPFAPTNMSEWII